MISNVGTVKTTCSGSSSDSDSDEYSDEWKFWKNFVSYCKDQTGQTATENYSTQNAISACSNKTDLMCVLGESHVQSASTKKAAFTRALPNEYRFTQMHMIRSDG